MTKFQRHTHTADFEPKSNHLQTTPAFGGGMWGDQKGRQWFGTGLSNKHARLQRLKSVAAKVGSRMSNPFCAAKKRAARVAFLPVNSKTAKTRCACGGTFRNTVTGPSTTSAGFESFALQKRSFVSSFVARNVRVTLWSSAPIFAIVSARKDALAAALALMKVTAAQSQPHIEQGGYLQTLAHHALQLCIKPNKSRCANCMRKLPQHQVEKYIFGPRRHFPMTAWH